MNTAPTKWDAGVPTFLSLRGYQLHCDFIFYIGLTFLHRCGICPGRAGDKELLNGS